MAKKTTKAKNKSSKKNSTTKIKKTLSIKKPSLSFPRLSYKATVSVLLLIAVLLLTFSVWGWWKYVFVNPDRLMSDMLDTSLQVSNTSKVTSQNSTQGSATQAVRLGFNPGVYSHTLTQMTQANQSGGKSVVVTETIGTQNADFVRYRAIELGANVKGIDKILNVWASQNADKEKGVEPTFLNQAGLTVVPFGNLGTEDRATLTNMFDSKDVYHIEGSTLEWSGLRPRMVYNISIKPADLISVLREYSKMTGTGDPSQLNPDDYKNARKLEAQMVVDPWSRQLVSISYPDSGRVENYTGYGIRDNLGTKLPGNTITMQELQSRTQSIAQ